MQQREAARSANGCWAIILEEGRIRNRRLARLLIIGTGNLGLFDFGTGTQSFALLFLFF